MHYLLALVVLQFHALFYVLFYNEKQEREYVPKRIRKANRKALFNTHVLLRIISQIIAHCFNVCAMMIKNAKTKHKVAKRRRIARSYNKALSYFFFLSFARQSEGVILCKTALLALRAERNKSRNYQNIARFDSDSKSIGIDNRATAFMSGDPDDFDRDLRDSNRVVKGFGGSRTTGAKIGTAKIQVEDDQGTIHTFRLPNSYYIQGIKERLFSPQHWAQCLQRQNIKNARETTTATEVKLHWLTFTKTILLDSSTNVATFQTAPGSNKFNAFCYEAAIDTEEEDLNPISIPAPNYVSDDEDIEEREDKRVKISTHKAQQILPTEGSVDENLPNTKATPKVANQVSEGEELQSTEQDEAALLQHHYRYGHAPFSKLQEMARQGIIPRRLRKCRIPVCAACMFGKATRRQWRQKAPMNKIAANGSLLKTPGQVVSVDQLISPSAGYIAQMTGNLTTDRYKVVTVFVDHYSGFGYVFLQKSTSAAETLEAKIAFERVCQSSGHKVLHYHADNGIFKANAWVENCRTNGQGLTFAAVDAHHQNGKAEARIRRLQETARTMMNHATRRWPQEMAPQLWPYAIRSACLSLNATPRMKDHKKRSPDELFHGTTISTNPKHWKHPFCPAYVLDKNLASGKHLSKWKNRSRVGMYLGQSPLHARSVSLILDLTTGLVSPQFHVQFDCNFDTVKQIYADDKEHTSIWKNKAGLTTKDATDGDNSTKMSAAKKKNTNTKSPAIPLQTVPATAMNPETTENPMATTETGEGNTIVIDEPVELPRTAPTAPTVRRSNRPKKAVDRLIEAMCSEMTKEDGIGEIFCFKAQCPDDEQIDAFADILAMKAKADPDTLYLHEARKQPDWSEFEEAMQMEIEQQVNLGIYEIVETSTVPEGATILNAVWQLRRKRDARTGAIKKYKARCNIDGSKMKQGEHYEETYAPVAGWTAIRLLLALVLLHKWKTVQLDYVLAFPQAPAIRDLYMRIPAGFTLDGVDNPSKYVLKIKRNIYGGKDAGRTWFLYLKEKLERIGFVQSKYDDCIFYKGNLIYVLYTDDSILAGPDQAEIDRTVEEMKTVGLTLTVEGDLEDFLGVNFDRRTDGTIQLSQSKLTEQILNDLRLKGTSIKTKETPAASSKLLSRHQESEPFDNSFNFRSVIGKLHYLVAGSRSEIAYAVHQCARFAHEPKREHGNAVRWIGRYLKGTATNGTILKPDATKSLEVFVDSDFAGNWDPGLAGKDRSTARSRHGFYICYGGIPITYKSSLQQEIALSSTEAEITGLSYSLREAIPIIRILQEMHELGYPVTDGQTKVHCKVFEDNSGAIEIARIHKIRPRTKFLNNRLFHFRTFVDRGTITIHKIDTKEQPADILTKPLNETDFKRHRMSMNGW
jgi:hypothetical protein